MLNQLTSNAIHNSDGSYTNPLTGKQFLSFSQIADIVSYAKQKGIELVPEVDSPNHMDAIFTLLEAHRGSDFVNTIKSTVVADELEITSDAAVAWLKTLLTEVSGMFGDSSQHFHIGGDEFGYSVASNHEFISYVNELSSFLAEKGLTTRILNCTQKVGHPLQPTKVQFSYGQIYPTLQTPRRDALLCTQKPTAHRRRASSIPNPPAPMDCRLRALRHRSVGTSTKHHD